MSHPQIYPHGLTGRTIRLLTVEPGDVNSSIHCALQEISLDAPAPYYALSYCWGTSQSLVEITCNSFPLYVTPSLHSALLEYRRRGVDFPLWVDAVCIDQSNITERTSQVRMMQTIYSNAARVLVWLGEAEATDEVALAVLKAVNGPWAMFRDLDVGEIPLFIGPNHANHDAELAARVPDIAFDALAAFLLKPWFSRIWIVQELICARELTIWCGQQTLNEDFPVLEAAARVFMMSNCTIKTQLATTALEDKEVQGVGRSRMMCAGRLWGFKTLKDSGLSGIMLSLLITRYFQATDPRDKIFALIGLASDIGEEFVDYSKSYDDVVQELSAMLLDGRIETTSGSVLDLWSCITRDEDDNLSGPSWVVDWLKLRDSLYTPLITGYKSEYPMIYRKPEIQILEVDESKVLHVRGSVFDTITHIVASPVGMRQAVPQSEFLTFQHLPSMVNWYKDATTTVVTTSTDPDNIYQATGESLYEAFWRTLCCNLSGTDEIKTPTDDSGYVGWRSLIDIQERRYNMEINYRRGCELGRRLTCGFTGIAISALTYYFRQHKLLFVALPFSLPPLIQFVNQVYDVALKTVLLKLFQDYMQETTQVQIAQLPFEHSHSLWTQGRQFGITAQGLMGWVPLTARVGDNIGLFAGCRMPFVIRAFQEGYKIVGDAYMHGVMNGEGEASEGEMLKIL